MTGICKCINILCHCLKSGLHTVKPGTIAVRELFVSELIQNIIADAGIHSSNAAAELIAQRCDLCIVLRCEHLICWERIKRIQCLQSGKQLVAVRDVFRKGGGEGIGCGDGLRLCCCGIQGECRDGCGCQSHCGEGTCDHMLHAIKMLHSDLSFSFHLVSGSGVCSPCCDFIITHRPLQTPYSISDYLNKIFSCSFFISGDVC